MKNLLLLVPLLFAPGCLMTFNPPVPIPEMTDNQFVAYMDDVRAEVELWSTLYLLKNTGTAEQIKMLDDVLGRADKYGIDWDTAMSANPELDPALVVLVRASIRAARRRFGGDVEGDLASRWAALAVVVREAITAAAQSAVPDEAVAPVP